MTEPVPLTLAQRKKLLLARDVRSQRGKQLRDLNWMPGDPLPTMPLSLIHI